MRVSDDLPLIILETDKNCIGHAEEKTRAPKGADSVSEK
jgi:hypothetical protein